ncbi:uncharacterized protein LY79DRAFT_135076 [Colletotrichum navitas]|uniref:Uncharacterized protein n=1 Tax=Colletotrichum navitas TaxID=681940 RepID=A0AAD8Q2C6_9PEZI|nr:uncharacterized protein LY79DRAFT_135076 [Colletotrichum navitas]KAK1594622.1 hypothetical protein LY79DRAFT_135076 [Colletotrichum navitas]
MTNMCRMRTIVFTQAKRTSTLVQEPPFKGEYANRGLPESTSHSDTPFKQTIDSAFSTLAENETSPASLDQKPQKHSTIREKALPTPLQHVLQTLRDGRVRLPAPGRALASPAMSRSHAPGARVWPPTDDAPVGPGRVRGRGRVPGLPRSGRGRGRRRLPRRGRPPRPAETTWRVGR